MKVITNRFRLHMNLFTYFVNWAENARKCRLKVFIEFTIEEFDVLLSGGIYNISGTFL